MAKEKFDIIQSTCIPIEIDNCNTDLIIPARYLASTTRDPKFFGDAFMHDLRYDADGKTVEDFVMNKPEFKEAPRKGVHEIIVGGQNWGSGSSREHAAMEPRFLNVRVILAKSFARIHETNLKKQGMLALTFANKDDYDKVQENDRISLTGLKDFAPGTQFTITLRHEDGSEESFKVNHTYNEAQIAWFKAGSALNCH